MGPIDITISATGVQVLVTCITFVYVLIVRLQKLDANELTKYKFYAVGVLICELWISLGFAAAMFLATELISWFM